MLDTVETLKRDGLYELAGAMAYRLGRAKQYGCHYGMKSERAAAIAAFERGWLAEQEEMNQ